MSPACKSLLITKLYITVTSFLHIWKCIHLNGKYIMIFAYIEISQQKPPDVLETFPMASGGLKFNVPNDKMEIINTILGLQIRVHPTSSCEISQNSNRVQNINA